MDLLVIAYAVADELPARVQFSLGNQIRRSAGSVPANIAEGNGRSSRRDYVRFLAIAIASLRELQTHIEASRRLGMISEARAHETAVVGHETAALLTKLRRSMGSERGGLPG
jgi:four helix bundle protein